MFVVNCVLLNSVVFVIFLSVLHPFCLCLMCDSVLKYCIADCAVQRLYQKVTNTIGSIHNTSTDNSYCNVMNAP